MEVAEPKVIVGEVVELCIGEVIVVQLLLVDHIHIHRFCRHTYNTMNLERRTHPHPHPPPMYWLCTSKIMTLKTRRSRKYRDMSQVWECSSSFPFILGVKLL